MTSRGGAIWLSGMERIANAITVLSGWRRFAVAFGAGLVSALALAPFNLFPLLWLTMPVLVWLIDGAIADPGRRGLARLVPAALVGWAFGFGYFLGGLWWIGAAFLVDADDFAWLLPFAVLILPAGLALFWSLGAAAARAAWGTGWSRILVFAVAMSASEWLRGHVLTGLPWNAFGYALAPAPMMMQSASVVGLWGLTLAAFVIFAAPAALAGGRKGGLAFAACAAGLLALHLGFGALRLAAANDASVEGVSLRLVQPSLDQSEKWQVANEEAIVRRYLDLSDGGAGAEGRGLTATLLIWPESAFPFLLTQRPEVLAAIAALLPPGTTLITGAARAEPGVERVTAATPVFNSIYVIDDAGGITAAYDKVHLVPFGEYLPVRPLFDALGIRQLITLPGGFEAGDRRRTLRLDSAPPMGPLICYEAIFPAEIVDIEDRPEWLLNLTNDGWFGVTPGPYQHFAQARLRTVEEGLPLVRVANSGITAIVDAYGRVRGSLGLGEVAVLDGELPASLPPTPYARFGDWVFLLLLVVVAGTAALAGLHRRRASR